MRPIKPMRRDVTNSQWSAHQQQMNRIEQGLNRLLNEADLPQTTHNKV